MIPLGVIKPSGNNRRTVLLWRFTIYVPGTPLPFTHYFAREKDARAYAARTTGAIVVEPPHPFEYELWS